MTTDQDTLQQKGTVVIMLAQPGKGKAHLYPAEAQRKRKVNGE